MVVYKQHTTNTAHALNRVYVTQNKQVLQRILIHCLMFMGHEFKLDPRYQMFRDYEFLQTAIVLSNKSPLLPHTPHPFLINWSNHTGLYKSIFLFYLKTINNITVYGINGRWIQAWSTDGMVLTGEERWRIQRLSQQHFARHKSHTDCRRIKPRSPQWEVADCLSYGTAS